MSEYFPGLKSLAGRVTVELDLSLCNKSRFKNAAGVDTSKLI